MAKLAVILFLFALWAVAMSARIAREEPTNKPIDQLNDQIKSLASQLEQFLQSPELKQTFDNLATNLQDVAKKVSNQVQTQLSEAPKSLV